MPLLAQVGKKKASRSGKKGIYLGKFLTMVAIASDGEKRKPQFNHRTRSFLSPKEARHQLHHPLKLKLGNYLVIIKEQSQALPYISLASSMCGRVGTQWSQIARHKEKSRSV